MRYARTAQPHSVTLGGPAHWLIGFCYLEAGSKATAVGCLALQHYPLADLVAERSMDPVAIKRYQLGWSAYQASTVFEPGMVSDPLQYSFIVAFSAVDCSRD